MATVLVIDDDHSIRHLVKAALDGQHGLQVVEAADGDAGLALLEEFEPAVVLLDVYLPKHNGLELFRKIKAIDHKVPIIFITGDTSSETAIEAMRAGAFDYLSKPLKIDQLCALTQSAVRERQLMNEPVALTVGNADASGERFIGKSKPMIEVYKQIGRVTSQNVTVLIRGASGCGKELVARAIVQHGDRRDAKYVAINCAAIPDQLLESELFGHEKGAFTGAEKRRIGRFEQCDGGTIFFDEIGDMSPVIQGKVLRLLQEQKFERVGGNELITTDVRVIAATNRPLEQMVEDGEFRDDLLYRLNGFTISLPNLTERREDIPLLLEYFLRRAKGDMNRPEMDGIAPAALELLCSYDWPGNIRQLQSVIRQSLLNTTGTVIGPESLPAFVRSWKKPSTTAQPGSNPDGEALPVGERRESKRAISVDRDQPQSLEGEVNELPFELSSFIAQRLSEDSKDLYDEVIEQVERFLIAKVLEVTDGNQSKAADILGITRGKVRDRIASFDIRFDRNVTMGQKELDS